MQRLYTCNFPPDETVNFRKGAGRRFPVIIRIAYGEIVEGKVHNSTWHFVSYKGQMGYIMSRYLSLNPPQNTKDNFVPVLVDTATNGNGGRLNIRESPDQNAKIITRVANGTTLWARKELEGWHEVSFQGKQGYVMAKFLKPAKEKAESSTKPPPKVAYPFSRERAVLYALNHSDNSPSPHPCKNRNLSFASTDGKNDCADFVHQCLTAGGAPMFDGWHYPLKGIPVHWKNSGWPWTNRGRLALFQKGWIQPQTVDKAVLAVMLKPLCRQAEKRKTCAFLFSFLRICNDMSIWFFSHKQQPANIHGRAVVLPKT